MQSLKMKKGMAVALTASMVLGSAITAFAADATSGSTTGAGTSEGHVEKKATKVILPVAATDYSESTFAYVMDPERLISGSSGKKFADGATFPEAASDTGVYFLTDSTTNKYENSSKALEVTNQSSHDIKLTVTAEMETTTDDTDIPLVAKDAIASADEASLYLGLVVGSDTGKAITKETAATAEVTVPGKADNFKVDVKADKSGYEYRALTLDEYKAIAGNESATEIAWDSKTFNLEGAVTKDKAITSETTAPSVKVTWSWVDPSANAAPSIAATTQTLTANTPVDIAVNLGTGDLKASAVTGVTDATGTYEYISLGYASYDSASGTVTLTAGLVDACISQNVTSLNVVFDDDESTSIPLTLTW